VWEVTLTSMFLGVYWKRRQETRERAARRVARWLEALGASSDELASWYLTTWSKKPVRKRALVIDADAIAKHLDVNRTDFGNEPIPDLGYSLSIWNGSDAGLLIHIGCYAPRLGNSVALSIDPAGPDGSSAPSDAAWRKLLRRALAIFDADDGVVITDRMEPRIADEGLWRLAWLSYRRRRGAGIKEYPTRR
jgi:hypothetical protein